MFDTIIRMKPDAIDEVTKLGLTWDYSKQFGMEEIDVYVNYVDDSLLTLTDDPDVILCDYYNINYDLVNCIEAVS